MLGLQGLANDDDIHLSDICNNCNVAERPLIKPNCLSVNNMLTLK